MISVAAALISYQVALAGDGSALEVQARLPAGSGTVLEIDRDAAPFIADVRVDGAKLQQRNEGWPAPACRRGCRLSYRVELSRAADAGDAAERQGDLIDSSPRAWLLRPEGSARLSVRVTAPAPLFFAAGLAQRDGAFEIASEDLPFAAPAFFGPLQLSRIPLGAQTLQVAVASGQRPPAPLLRFVAAQARAVADYFGRLPVDQTLLLVLSERGGGSHGRTLGGGGATVIWSLGDDAALDEEEWVLVHELVHTGFPDLQRRGQHWAEEGLSTYVEPVARARDGLLPAAKVWRDLVAGLPQGAGASGDGGLDGSPSWGSTYWGGALFWLLADVRIRERTGNSRSLEDALRGLVAGGGTIAVRWPLERALAVADGATGTRVLQDLYATMGAASGPVDLPALFGRLGVSRQGLDETAALAKVRASITARR